MLTQQGKAELIRLAAARDWTALRAAVAGLPAPELADVLRSVHGPERVLFFRALPRELATEVFSHLDPTEQDDLLPLLTNEETRRLLAELSPDDRTALLEELPGQVTQRLLTLLSPEDVREARQLLGYPEESLGRLMTPDYVAVRPEWTVAEALDHLRRQGTDSETIHVLYVTDAAGRLIGRLDLRRLILAAPEARIADLMDPQVISVNAYEDREQAVRLVEKYDLGVLPVVDSTGVLLGIVTVDDVMDVAEAEATEDFQGIGAVEPLAMPIRSASVGLLYRRRIVWLLALVFVNIFSGQIIAYYEATIAQVIALVFFLPLLIDSAGNAGSQAATLMVRGLATGDVTPADWLRLTAKELAVAAAMGGTMAAAVALLGLLRGGPEVAAVVALTTVLVVIVGGLIGLSLPFLLVRLGLDPAVASAPLITTVADITGVFIYLGIATWFLRIGG
jgi:magnesium transporter